MFDLKRPWVLGRRGLLKRDCHVLSASVSVVCIFRDDNVYICVMKVSKGESNFKRRKASVENGLDEGKIWEEKHWGDIGTVQARRPEQELSCAWAVEGRRKRAGVGLSGQSLFPMLYPGHPVYKDHILTFQRQESKEQVEIKREICLQSSTLLRRNQAYGPRRRATDTGQDSRVKMGVI